VTTTGTSRFRIALVVLATSAVCFAVGHVLAVTWTRELISTLGGTGITLELTDATDLNTPLLLTAAAFSACGLAGGASVSVAARIRQGPHTLANYLRATGIMFVGANLGIGAKAIALASVVVPQAVERSAGGGALVIDAGQLSLAGWTLAGVTGALLIHGSVTAVMAILAEDQPQG
jgi:hypothetical protein